MWVKELVFILKFLISGKIFGVDRNYLIAEAEYREGEGEEEDDVS